MKDQIPEYFVALVKQFANLASNQQSQRAIVNISESLDKCLDYDSRKLFFYMAPSYLVSNNKPFLSSLRNKNTRYNHSILVDRLKIKQNLTDTSEVESLLGAYITAVTIVVGKNKAASILKILPNELKSNI